MKKVLTVALMVLVGSTLMGADGEQLFKKCAGCHGPKGEKKALGKSAPISDMTKDELVKAMKGYKEGTLNKYGMGMLMKGQVANYSDEDIEKLAEYITTLKDKK